MPLEKPYLQQINLDGDGKFAKSLIFCSFAVVQKELHPFPIDARYKSDPPIAPTNASNQPNPISLTSLTFSRRQTLRVMAGDSYAERRRSFLVGVTFRAPDPVAFNHFSRY